MVPRRRSDARECRSTGRPLPFCGAVHYSVPSNYLWYSVGGATRRNAAVPAATPARGGPPAPGRQRGATAAAATAAAAGQHGGSARPLRLTTGTVSSVTSSHIWLAPDRV